MARKMWRSENGLKLLLIISCYLPLLVALQEGDPCELKINVPAICIVASKCAPIFTKYIKSGLMTADDVPSCGLGFREEIVCCPSVECCPDESGVKSNSSATIHPTHTSRVDNTERAAVRACRNIQLNEKRLSLSTHILDGIPVDDGFYPHMAAIAIDRYGNLSYSCGGSLISKRHVLTAAHCVNSQYETPVHVRLGSVNIETVNKFYQDIRITSNIRIHPDYVSTSKYNDIAILELAEEAKLSFYIFPACVETSMSDAPASSKFFVAGWGRMNLATGLTSKILLRAPLDIVPLTECNDLYATQLASGHFLKYGVIDKMICAADTAQHKKDSCQGDSGGPLVLETDMENNIYSIYGIISTGIGCASKIPGLYTRVAAYLDFIESVVWPNNIVD